MNKQEPTKYLIVENKKAKFDYFIEDTFEAGIVLQGWEVKSIRAGKITVVGCYAHITQDGNVDVIGVNIAPLINSSSHHYQSVDGSRSKRLLLKKQEISKLIGKTVQKGYTLVVTKLYWSNNKVKCELALAKGKNTVDKRDTVKQRDADRQIQRVMKNKLY